MLATVYKITIAIIIALGSAHSILTAVFYREFAPRALWFLGSGLALIVLGFLNIANFRQGKSDKTIQTLCVVSNAVFTALFIAASFIIYEPQVFAGIASCAAAAILAIAANKKSPRF